MGKAQPIPTPKAMAYLMPQERMSILWGKLFSPTVVSASAAAIFIALLTISGQGQQPNFGQGGPGQNAAANPAESSAYAAAIHQSDPAVRASAIQQFLIAYPNSSLRQPAIAQMMMAKREGNGGAGAPPMQAPALRPAMPVAAAPSAVMPVSTSFTPPQTQTTPRDSLLQQAPKPAVVTLASHTLMIKAENSTLSQILHEISTSTGMTVDGLSKDERIFGTYGPGDPHEVLLALLQGSGYNVLMLGDSNGSPRQLSLTDRTGSGVASAAPAQRKSDEEEDDSEQEVQQTPPPEPSLPVNQPPGPDGSQQRNPAEIQQEMMRLRQQQQPQQPQ